MGAIQHDTTQIPPEKIIYLLIIRILECSHYGAQAVVVSIDPKRVYLKCAEDAPHGVTVATLRNPPNPESAFCWWQVTVKGGREVRDLDAIELAKVCRELVDGKLK